MSDEAPEPAIRLDEGMDEVGQAEQQAVEGFQHAVGGITAAGKNAGRGSRLGPNDGDRMARDPKGRAVGSSEGRTRGDG